MSEERWMSEIEVSLLQDRIAAEKPSLQHKEHTEDGYELYYRFNDGTVYRVICDHETYVVGAFEGYYPEYQEVVVI